MIAEYDGIASHVHTDAATGGRLLLGAEQCAKDLPLLRREGVTHIVNCAGLACANHHPAAFEYLKLNLQDTAREDISAAFYDALDFIDASLARGGSVFVHCQHGVSRSATIVIAYVMWRRRPFSYDDALDAVRAIRPTVNPNIGFACSLLQWGANIAEPPATVQLWAAQPLAAEGAADGAAAATHAMKPLLLPPTLLGALEGAAAPFGGGSAAADATVRQFREEARAELRRHGPCVVAHLGAFAVCWVTADAPPGATAEAARLLHRLVRYHHLPAFAAAGDDGAAPAELFVRDRSEDDAFWAALRPPPPAAPPPVPLSLSAASTRAAIPACRAVGARRHRRRPGSPCTTPTPTPTPNPTPARLAAAAAAAAAAARRRRRRPRAPLRTLGAVGRRARPPGVCRARIITPGSTARTEADGASPRGATPPASSRPRCCRRAVSIRTGRPRSSARRRLPVLQAVSSELLLLLQHEFDLLAPDAPPRRGRRRRPAAQAAADEEMSERELDPAHLLTVCQELLLAQPPNLDDSHAVAASLLQLLSELAPHLADKGHTPHLVGLGHALADFVAALPDQRGEALLREEEVMLRAIARAGREAGERAAANE